MAKKETNKREQRRMRTQQIVFAVIALIMVISMVIGTVASQF